MALTITREDLRDLCRIDAEISESITDAEVNVWIDQGIKLLTGIIVDANENWSRKVDTITLDGSDSYSLPSDHYKTLLVEVQDGSDWRQIDQIPLYESGTYENADGRLSGPVYYQLDDQTIVVLPSSTTGTIRLTYVPNAGALAQDSSTFNGRMGWEEYVVSYVGYKYHRRIGEPTVAWERSMIQLESKVTAQAATIHAGKDAPIRSIEHERNWPGFPVCR